MKKNAVIALRWLGVLPCAVAAYLLGYALYKLIFLVQTWFSFGGDADSWLNKYFFAALSAGMGGFLFVTLASMLAPSARKYVALILMILLAMFMGIAVFAGAIQGHVIGMIEAIASVVGAVVAYIQLVEAEKE